LDLEIVAVASLALLFGGGVKGVIGLGLPLTSIAILGSFTELREAAPLLILPSVVSNFWQMVQDRGALAQLRRFWVLNLTSCVGIWLGTMALASFDAQLLLGILGALVVAYAGFNLLNLPLSLAPRLEAPLAPAVGVVSGFISGMTGSLGMVGAIYIQALGLDKDRFVQAIASSFFVLALFWGVALIAQGVLDGTAATISAITLVPMTIGLWIGRRLRDRLSQAMFRRVLLAFLLAIGLNLLRRVLL
jgi:uncharacterized protein